MAKSKQKTVNLFKQIAEATGGVDKDETSPYFIDTGNLALNFICSGRFIKNAGVPAKIIEVYGPPASSKSLLGNCILGGCQRMGGIGVVLDIEKAFSFEFSAKTGHLNPDELLVYDDLATYEQVERKITNVTRAIRKIFGPDKPLCFILDSISVLQTEREHKELDLAENATAADKKKIGLERPGERARAAGDMLRKLNPFLKENNATLFVINQVRSKIGFSLGFNNETTAGGGRSLEFYASLRLRTSTRKQILNAELLKKHKVNIPIGVNLNFTNKKNRSFKPGWSCAAQLYFDYGINPLSGLLSVLITDERIDGKAGNWRVNEPYANGQEIKFKISKEKDTVPLEILYACPALLGVETKEEVEEYLKPHMEAIEITNSDKIAEVDVDEEGDGDESAIDEFLKGHEKED